MIKKISLSLVLVAVCASQTQAITGADVYKTFLSTKTRRAVTLTGVVGSTLATTWLGFAGQNYLSTEKDDRNVMTSCQRACDAMFVTPYKWVAGEYWRMGLAAAVTATAGYGLYKYFKHADDVMAQEKAAEARAIKAAQEKADHELAVTLAQEQADQEKAAKQAKEQTDRENALRIQQQQQQQRRPGIQQVRVNRR